MRDRPVRPIGGKRQITVEDLIALRRPTIGPLWSQDGRRLAVVTEKADAIRRERIFTLQVWDARAIATYVADGRQPFMAALPAEYEYELTTTGNVPAISRVKWKEDGERLYFIGNDGGRPAQVYAWDVGQSSVVQVTNATASVVAYDANQSAIIFSVRKPIQDRAMPIGFPVGRRERLYGLLGLADVPDGPYAELETAVLNLASGRVTTVNETVAGQVYTPLVDYWLSPDSRYAVSVRPPVVVPPAWEKYDVRIESYRMRRTRKGDPIPWLTTQEYTLIDCTTGRMTPLLNAPVGGAAMVPPRWQTATWSPDGRFVALNSNFLPLDGSSEAPLRDRTSGPWVVEVEIANGTWRPVRKLPEVRAATSTELESVTVRYVNDAHSLTVTEVSRSGAAVSYQYSRTGNRWTQTGSRPGEPERSRDSKISIKESLNVAPDLWVSNPAMGRERRISEWNPQLQELAVHSAEVFVWKDEAGRTWQGGLILPAGPKPDEGIPLVIQTHGFDTTRFLWEGAYPAPYAAQVLAGHGIAVLQIQDRRGSSGSLGEAQMYMDAYLSAIKALELRRSVNPARVGLQGFSRTSYHVRYTLTHTDFPFRAAVSAEGVDRGYWQYLMAVGDGVEATRSAVEYANGGKPFGAALHVWAERAPPFLAHEVSVPLRFETYGRRSVLYNWEMYAALRILDRPVEMIVIPYGRHVLVRPEQRAFALHGYVDWFRFWLNDEEDPDPSKAEQYERWRALKRLQQAHKQDLR